MVAQLTPKNTDITVRIASTIEDLIACQRIRSACFMSGEEPEPYMEQFDGNDFSSATHLVAFQDGAPVGTIRVRVLNGITDLGGADGTWEKLAVLPGKRGQLAILNALAQAAIRYSVRKGITAIHGLVRDPRVAKFWKRAAGGVLTDAPSVYYEDRAYRRIFIDLRPFHVSQTSVDLLEVEPDSFMRDMNAELTVKAA